MQSAAYMVSETVIMLERGTDVVAVFAALPAQVLLGALT